MGVRRTPPGPPAHTPPGAHFVWGWARRGSFSNFSSSSIVRGCGGASSSIVRGCGGAPFQHCKGVRGFLRRLRTPTYAYVRLRTPTYAYVRLRLRLRTPTHPELNDSFFAPSPEPWSNRVGKNGSFFMLISHSFPPMYAYVATPTYAYVRLRTPAYACVRLRTPTATYAYAHVRLRILN